MSRLRIALRLPTLVALTLLALVAKAPADVLLRGEARRRMRARAFRAWSRVALRVMGVRVVVEGAPPPGGFLLVCNHLGYLDVAVLASRTPVVFVSKAEVASWPLLGPATASFGTIFVERERRMDVGRVNASIAGALDAGLGVVVFPEGTSTDGTHVLPFRAPLLQPAIASGRPVHHAALRYATPAGSPPARDAVCWWGDMTFAEHFVHLLGLPGIECRLAFGRQPVLADDRRQLALRAQEAVAEAAHVPVRVVGDLPAALTPPPTAHDPVPSRPATAPRPTPTSPTPPGPDTAWTASKLG